MDHERLLVTLCTAAVTEGQIRSSSLRELDDAEWAELYRYGKLHDLAHLVAEGARLLSLKPPAEIAQKLERDSLIALYRAEQMTYELSAIKAALSEAEIPHLPLKGSVLREFYPSLGLRVSCDVDLLVDRDRLAAARETLISRLGYTDYAETSHDISFRAPSGFLVELHFDLFEAEKSARVAALLSRVWEYALPSEESPYTYCLSDEMFYFYHVAHMAKHLIGGGCGLRPFLDLYILHQSGRIGNDGDRAALLALGGLSAFESACMELVSAWMEDEEMTDRAAALASFVFEGGVYGNLENRIAMKCSRGKGRLTYLLSRVFPSFSAMKKRYPLLKRAPYLTPFAYIYRLFSPIWSKRKKKIIEEAKLSSSITNEELSGTEYLLAELGLLER